ncbi:MAG: hypothetical protein D6765_13775, partial [Bacteroidetes bacterium]
TLTLVCNDLVHVALDDHCEALITPDMILEGDYPGLDSDYAITIITRQQDTLNNPLDGAYIGEELTVTIHHVPSGNSCWGKITLEDKWAPVLQCATDTILVACHQSNFPKPAATDNCDASPLVQVVAEEIHNSDPCQGVVVRRVYIAVDDFGNLSDTCSQVFRTENPPAPTFPPDRTFPNSLVNSPNHFRVRPTPFGAGVPNVAQGLYCPFEVSHQDFLGFGCGNTFTIARRWTVSNTCTGEVFEHLQWIRVVDEQGPTVQVPPVSLDLNLPPDNQHEECRSTGFLPAPALSDASGQVLNVRIFTPLGEPVYANGVDGRDGGYIPFPGLPAGVHPVTYHAEDPCGNATDLVVLVEVADRTAPVAVCDEITSVSLSSEGSAVLFADVLDDGSYDLCCVDRFEVRRMNDPCGVSGNTTFGPSVTFCCLDIIQGSVPVIFRVYDCAGNFNDCMVTVQVEDKIEPELISCPPPQTITCDFYLEHIEPAIQSNDFSVLNQFGTPDIWDNCTLIFQSADMQVNLDACKQGTLVRTWVVTDPAQNTPVVCTQTIQVEHISDWGVEFPDDRVLDCGVDDMQVFEAIGEPTIFDQSCELIAVSYEDQLFDVVPDACFKLVRRWTVINWCAVGEEVEDEVVENSEAEIVHVLNGCPLPLPPLPQQGCVFFPPLRPEADLNADGNHSAEPGELVPNDRRTFRDGLNAALFDPVAPLRGAQPDGFITYQQVVKVIDDQPPQLLACDIPPVLIEDNDCSATVILPLPEVEDCVGADLLSFQAQSPLGDGFGPFYDVSPGEYEVLYTVTDNCGNASSCTAVLEVVDVKPPTPYCETGAIIELNQTDPPSITIHASELDAGSFDNCSDELVFSFSSDINDTVKVFDCFQVNLTVAVEVWVHDMSGNSDFCITTLTFSDNAGDCMGDPLVAGAVHTETGEPLPQTLVSVNGTANGTFSTDAEGRYAIPGLLPGGDYSVVPRKDGDDLTGVTTFDLVLITRHILNVQPLESPYRMLAADANRSGAVTTFDVVLLRRLILGIDTALTDSDSWRFVPAAFQFNDPENPFTDPVPEALHFNDLQSPVSDADFVAVKVGDVNLSHSLGSEEVEERQNATLPLYAPERSFLPGEGVLLELAAERERLTGLQFSLAYDPQVLEFRGLGPG